MTYHLTRVSENAKTGPIPVSTTSRAGCPDSCALKDNGCYAEHGPLRLHWDKVTSGERGYPIFRPDKGFARRIHELPAGQLWRHNQAGDFLHKNGVIDRDEFLMIVEANRGRRGFAYTHHDMRVRKNRDLVRRAITNGFVVNASADNPQQADYLFDRLKLPTVVLLPTDAPQTSRTPKGHPIVVCPADHPDVTCATCQVCANPDRKSIIGFRAHGTKIAAANLIARGA